MSRRLKLVVGSQVKESTLISSKSAPLCRAGIANQSDSQQETDSDIEYSGKTKRRTPLHGIGGVGKTWLEFAVSEELENVSVT